MLDPVRILYWALPVVIVLSQLFHMMGTSVTYQVVDPVTGNVLSQFNGLAASDSLGATCDGLSDIDGDQFPATHMSRLNDHLKLDEAQKARIGKILADTGEVYRSGGRWHWLAEAYPAEAVGPCHAQHRVCWASGGHVACGRLSAGACGFDLVGGRIGHGSRS